LSLTNGLKTDRSGQPQELYDNLIHGEYYPPPKISGSGDPPERYRTIAQLAREFGPSRCKAVLEIGCENAVATAFLRSELGIPVDSYCCADISSRISEMIANSGLRCFQLDIGRDQVPLEDHSIDLVIMSEVLEHVLDPDHALRECARLLSTRGVLVLSTPNLSAWFNRVFLLLGYQPVFTETSTSWTYGRPRILLRSRPVGHLRCFTPRALRDMLPDCGLQLIVLKGLALEPGMLRYAPLSVVDNAFSRIPSCAAETVVVCRSLSQC
jgi:SAM-dependent methyltransferase